MKKAKVEGKEEGVPDKEGFHPRETPAYLPALKPLFGYPGMMLFLLFHCRIYSGISFHLHKSVHAETCFIYVPPIKETPERSPGMSP